MKHQKHTALTRPYFGTFHRNEWAIIGTPCGQIKTLSYQIIDKMKEKYAIAYVDADHAHGKQQNLTQKDALDYGATLNYTDKINFHRFDSKKSWNKFQYRNHFNDEDMVLVNGNHFTARHQIVVIDPKKEVSLSKKIDRLTDVTMILTTDDTPIYEFLENHLDIQKIPIFKISEIDKIIDILHQKMISKKPPLYGLVLIGGKSTRMGKDKSQIDYHGMPQREFVYHQLENVCEKVFISCRPDQEKTIHLPTISDTFVGLGPFGGICSAFRAYPDAAWLVIATDLPLVNEKTIQQLVENRNISKLATAFNSPKNQFPEPLITIWEPRAYPVLLQFLTQGYSCPRKVLINSDVQLLNAENAENVLKNVNHPEEIDEVRKLI